MLYTNNNNYNIISDESAELLWNCLNAERDSRQPISFRMILNNLMSLIYKLKYIYTKKEIGLVWKSKIVSSDEIKIVRHK